MAPAINTIKLVATAIATFASTDKFIIVSLQLWRRSRRSFASLGRFTGHDFSRFGWRFDVYIDFLGLAATAEKLAAEEEQRGRHDNYKNHEYGHDCGVAAGTTIIISHKIYPPLCTHHSLFIGDVTVFRD
jgi:hypothetical protein